MNLEQRLESESLMRVALNEARASTRAVRPNPKVGAAIQIASTKQIISAHHEKCGENHAEIIAIKKAKAQGLNLKAATIAVTLEPCSHWGKTPPCVDSIIEEKFSKVIVGGFDPYEKVSGSGIRKLEAAGIEVEINVLKEECESLNREWLFAHRNHRPFITVKMATSLDGKFYSAEGQSKWITSENSRNYAHQLRARVDAILTSSTTIEKDNPSFTVRENGIESPTQPSLFVLSRRKNFALNDFKVFSRIGGAQILESADLNESAKTLFENGHYDLMLEAGPKLISEFFELSLVDEVWHFVNTSYLGGSQSCLKALNQGRLLGKSFKIVKMETFDDSNFLMILSPL